MKLSQIKWEFIPQLSSYRFKFNLNRKITSKDTTDVLPNVILSSRTES